MLRALLTATALALAVTSLAPAHAGEEPLHRTLSLTGHGEVRMAPDMAIVTVGVLSQAGTAAAALAANTQSMHAIFAALTAAGIDNKDMQTSNFSVQPRYDFNNSGEPPRLAGYDVANSVTIAVRKLDGLGAVLDKVVAAGSNQINGIQFEISKPEPAMDEARKLAVADAARKAAIYAGATSIALGNIVSISENTSNQPPVIMQAKMLGAERASDVPVAQGEQAISVDVSMVWEIK